MRDHGALLEPVTRAIIGEALNVETQVVVELKAVSRLEPVFARQLLTYLRLLDLPVGLLLNFGAPTLSEGIKRVVHSPRGHHSSLRGSVSPCERS